MRSRLRCVRGALRFEGFGHPARSMNEQQFANQLRQALNEGSRLEARTLERLRAARLAALERYPRVAEHAPALADNVLGRSRRAARISRVLLVPLLLLALGLAFLYSAQQTRRVTATIEVDTQLLADDLPIDAYLDKGFEAWLNKRRPR